MENDQQLTGGADTSAWSHFQDDDDVLLNISEDLHLNTSVLRSDEKYAGFDNNVGDTWIYPSNFPERAYQYNIVQKALFHNTLVVLPTGLGKTFIAAVVMYNMYRWYPMGKVIFMAPTRPLVSQQIEACCKIVGIPSSDSVEITGKLNKASRALLWQSKRVFFATPQSVQSDILDAELDFPFHAVKLVVVDEAHKAKGRYAYTEVISTIWQKNKFFRILALSATPGRRKEDVEEVIRNLFISNIEVRTEDSVDVVSYVHKRQIKTVVVKLGQKLEEIRDELLAITDPHIRNLIENRLISGRPGSISRNWLVMEQKKFRESLINNRTPLQKELSSDFSICISVYHAIELLERHGLRVFLNNFDETQDGGTKFVVILRPDLRRLIERVREDIGPNPFAVSDQCMVNGEIAPIPTNIDFGHPKFEIARDHVAAHFEQNKDTRVIIFCEYRESVMLMHRLLLQHRPLIRPRVFVGKGGTGSIRAVTQQQQMKVMADFRSGVSNALIATSVAEEGIDVGEVDLIVCFDINTSNPTRFIQRIGRTGRKKQGQVVILATEGKEYSMLKDVLSERNRLNKSISRGGEFASAFYRHAPRMVPTEFNPKCLKTFVQPAPSPQEKIKNSKSAQPKSNRNSKPNQKHDLRHFFKQKVTLNDEDKHIFENAESTVQKNNSSLDENEPIINFSPPKFIEINNKVAKKIAKFVRTSSRGQTQDVQKAITSKKLSTESLEFLFDFSPDLLQNVWTHMQALWKRGIKENSLPSKGLTNEEKQAVRVYLQLINVYGTKENIAADVAQKQMISKSLNFSNLATKYNVLFQGLKVNNMKQDNIEFIMEKFEKISDLLPSEKNMKSSFAQSMVYDVDLDEIDSHDSRRDYSNACIVDSKYMSQWEELSHNSSTSHNYEATPHCKPSNKSSDDEVVFVGVSQQQSTPIRKEGLKQTLLNFNATPIAKQVIQRSFVQTVQRSNRLDNAVNLKRKRPETPENRSIEGNESDVDLFDDQFDAIIAANSKIIENIENNKEQESKNQLNCLRSGDIGLKQTNNKQAGTCANSSSYQSHLAPKTPTKAASSDLMNRVPSSVASNATEKYNSGSLHPDLVDIDFKNFSESFSEEMADNCNSSESPKRTSPDIFEDLAECSTKQEVAEASPVKRTNLNQQRSETSPLKETTFMERLSEASPLKETTFMERLSEASPLKKTAFMERVSETSPLKQTTSKASEVSPCLLTKKILTWKEVRQKYLKSNVSTTPPKPSHVDESVIGVSSKIRPKRRIIDSDSDSSESGTTKQTGTDIRKVIRKNTFQKSRLLRRRVNDFIDDEAVVSGSATEDELEHTVGGYMIDSVVVHDDEAENDAANMTQVYLRSVRSPDGVKRGAFKIPGSRVYDDASRIFSQAQPEENNTYLSNSFVVLSDEESEVDRSMCPLEKAEAILKEKRRAKRKAKMSDGQEFNRPAKKKRVLRIHNSSDESDFV